MISHRAVITLAVLATSANAATLPLKPGSYVLADTPCKAAPFAAMFEYKGQGFSYPHASRCRSTILSHSGQSYRVKETCAAQGDGTPAKPVTLTSTYTVKGMTQVDVRKTGTRATSPYRWCKSTD